MSHRKLNRDPVPLREQAYVALPDNLVMEALWEALDALEAQGMDLGPKARLVLEKRRKIKQDFPKPPEGASE